MSKMQVLESLLGETVAVETLSRTEEVHEGELIEIGTLGPIVKAKSHGREYVIFTPMSNVSYISHKVLDIK